MNFNTNQGINFSEILAILKKRWLVIFTIVVLATVGTGILNFFVLEPQYETSTKVFIGKDENNEDGYSSSDIQMYQKLLKTYAEAIRTNDLIERAIDESSFDLTTRQILDELTVIPVADTQILEVKYKSKNAEEAADTLNRIIDEFITTSRELVPNGNIKIIQKVRLPEEPVSPNKVMNIAIALVLGLMASIALVLLLEYMNNTYENESQIEKELNIPVLGKIPNEDLN